METYNITYINSKTGEEFRISMHILEGGEYCNAMVRTPQIKKSIDMQEFEGYEAKILDAIDFHKKANKGHKRNRRKQKKKMLEYFEGKY